MTKLEPVQHIPQALPIIDSARKAKLDHIDDLQVKAALESLDPKSSEYKRLWARLEQRKEQQQL